MQYKKININICDNGYIIETPDTKESFVFSDKSKKSMEKWLDEHTDLPGQVKDFCDGLDGKNKGIEHKPLEFYWSLDLAKQYEIDKDILNSVNKITNGP